MGRRSVRFGGTAAAVLLVAGAVTSNQVLNGGVWSVPWLAAALLVAGCTVVLDRRMNPAAVAPAPVLYPGVAGPDGLPLLLADLPVTELGVHEGRFTPAPYIPRPGADAELAHALSDGEHPSARRVVLVEGPRLAGTTRTLAEAAVNGLGDHRAAWFADDPQVPLADMVALAGRWARRDSDDHEGPAMGVVVWLERLSAPRVRELAGLLASSITDPTGRDGLPDGVWLLATLDGDELAELRDREQIEQTLDATTARVAVAALTEDERTSLAAVDAYAVLRPAVAREADVFIGRLMVSWTAIRRALTPGRDEHSTDRIALLHAVTDWERARMRRPLTDDILTFLFTAYRNGLTTARPRHPAAGLSGALTWATTHGTGKERGRPALITQVPTGRHRGDHQYLPHPLLSVLADDITEGLAWPVSTALWDYADRFSTPGQRHAIALTALRRQAYDAAARLLDHDGTPPDPTAYKALADHYRDRQDVQTARRWYRRTITTGHPDAAPRAMNSLGIVEYRQKRMEQARDWYLRAVESGHPVTAPAAMRNLGLLEEDQGRIEQARDWYLRAVESGHPDEAPAAMRNLGFLEREQGRIEQARDWYLRAIESGHPDQAPKAMTNLGFLEEKQRRMEQARDWYLRAIESDHPDEAPRATFNLGTLEYGQGLVEQARDWYLRAIESGHPDQAPKAMTNLGVLEEGQGRVEQARDCYLRVIDSGHPDEAPAAMRNLGYLESEQGRIEQARDWYLRAIDSDHPHEAPKAMTNLGTLQYRQGRVEQARDCYLRAVESGHPDEAPRAMRNLGVLEHGQGRVEQALDWYLRAVESGHPDQAPRAMADVGSLEEDRGRIEEARDWYEKAEQTDHPEAGPAARRALDRLDRRAEEQRRAQHFGQYGWQAYADPNLMTGSTGDDRPGDPPATADGASSDDPPG